MKRSEPRLSHRYSIRIKPSFSGDAMLKNNRHNQRDKKWTQGIAAVDTDFELKTKSKHGRSMQREG
jgi:hypothetical protein